MCFNLLDEPWLPVLFNDGSVKYVSVLELLENATNIHNIASTNPMDRFAALRFLLALLYWSREHKPEDWQQNQSVPASWLTFLLNQRDKFNLLGEKNRFFQDQAQKSEHRNFSTHYLIHEIPSGSNHNHFKHSHDKVTGLCPSCCALGLLRLPVFTTIGGKGYTGGINKRMPVYALIAGSNLLNTLYSNLKIDDPMGTPFWDYHALSKTTTRIPILEGFTALPRRIWLGGVEQGQTCIKCGRRDQGIIRECTYKSSQPFDSEQWHDPHALWIQKKENERPLQANDLRGRGNLKADKPLVDILHGLQHTFPQQIQDNFTFHIFGFTTDGKAANLDAWEMIIKPLHSSCEEDFLYMWERAMEDMDYRIDKTDVRRQISGKDKPEKIQARNGFLLQISRPHYEHKNTNNTIELVTGDKETVQRAKDTYSDVSEYIAPSLSPGITTRARERRNKIRNLRPYIKTKEDQCR